MKLEKFIEGLLWDSRFVVLVALIASLLASFSMFYIATVDAYYMISHILEYASPALDVEHRNALRSETITHVVELVAGYLLAPDMLLFGLGLYELFIGFFCRWVVLRLLAVATAMTRRRALPCAKIHPSYLFRHLLSRPLVPFITGLRTLFRRRARIHFPQQRTAVAVLGETPFHHREKCGERSEQHAERRRRTHARRHFTLVDADIDLGEFSADVYRPVQRERACAHPVRAQLQVELFLLEIDRALAGDLGVFRIHHQRLTLKHAVAGLEVGRHAADRCFLIACDQQRHGLGEIDVGEREQQLADVAARHDRRDLAVGRTEQRRDGVARALESAAARDGAFADLLLQARDEFAELEPART